MNHWIFGYGSLICPDSRARTGLTGAALPVVVKGFERHWSVAVNYAELTVLGIRTAAPEAEVGGVLFALDDDAFSHFDAREVEYERVQLSADQVRPLASERPLPNGDIWVYIPPARHSPHPIAQSYLDVALRGCLTISEAFAEHFLQHTHSWKPRLNDRNQPLYPRPLKPEHQTVLPDIDHLLARYPVSSSILADS
ncbi:MAG: gamma-glutamylcyclotransferase [Natronospirillum sp.]|uniref:gamma-glutamylcyclotransferase family protein n=1 Tax=Natronospirillum sp. TaxID=2812955 RepID=UPI0025F9232C|nr:gamma-glutamylcyclotransferase family protein [Natronospirillum sp.]MCH8551180.1 gamma-glutamylcyclotransferase [Natronospirillum sp.]